AAPRFQEIAGAFEDAGSHVERRRGPWQKARLRRRHGRRRKRIVAFADAADRLGVDRRKYPPLDAGSLRAVDERPRLGRQLTRADFGEQRSERGPVAEFDAGGIASVRTIKVARQGNLRVARVTRVADPLLRTLEDRPD